MYYFINYYVLKKENFKNIKLPKDKAIKINITHPNTVFQIGLHTKGTYLDSFFELLKITTFPFPSNSVYTQGGADTIQKLIKNELHLAFIDEEVLLAYIHKKKNEKELKDILDIQEFKPINFSLIGVCYDTPFLFITKTNSNIKNFYDIKNKNNAIGVLKNSADEYHLKKIKYNIRLDNNIKEYSTYEILKQAIIDNKIQIIFITDTKKNKILFDLTENENYIFISPVVTQEEIEKQKLVKLIDTYQTGNYMTYKTKIKKTDIYNPKYRIGIFSQKKYVHNLDKKKENYTDEIEFNSFLSKTINDKTKIKQIKNKILKYDSYLELVNNLILYYNENKNNIYPNIIYIPQNYKKRTLLFNTIKLLSESKTIQNKFKDIKIISMIDEITFKKNLKKEEFYKLNELKNRNSTILDNFYSIKKKKVNLNDFYNNINKSHFLDTYSSKLILVARNDLNHTLVEKCTANFINNLNIFKKHINEYKNQNQFLNYTVYDAFNFNHLLNVNKDIPIHESSKSIYIKHNLLKTKTIFETNI